MGGSGSGREAYGDKGKVRKSLRGIRGHGQGQAVVERHSRLWAGSARGREAYGDIGRHVVWWGSIRGHEHANGDVGRHAGP